MKRTVLACCSLALVAGSLAWSQKDGAKPASKLEPLAWLAGSWTTKLGPMTVEEHWIEPKGGLMLGCSRTVAGEKAVEFEFLRLEERDGGKVVYVAHPNAKPGTEFVLTGSEGDAWTFENPEHDFPRKIRYARNSDGSVTATVSGEEDGRPRSLEFRYERLDR